MQPTQAPWALKQPGSSSCSPSAPDVPPVSKGETTRAPWINYSGGSHTRQKVEAVISAEPRMPQQESVDYSQQDFVAANRRISNTQDLKLFLHSNTAKDFMAFILALNEAVKGRQLSDPCHVSEAVLALKAALDTLWRWVDEIPPAQQSLRYGNPAYRVWFQRMTAAVPALLRAVLPEQLQHAAPELGSYLADSFGNSTRIDYGTGHETTFCAFLYCLAKLGVLQQQDCPATVCIVFARYLTCMGDTSLASVAMLGTLRAAHPPPLLKAPHLCSLAPPPGAFALALALAYLTASAYCLCLGLGSHLSMSSRVEPAGSHGVWGLDDYQFLPFIWGSAQLVDHPSIRPPSIHDPEVLSQNADDYLYLKCVQFVKQVKKGPLQETSPMLNDISGLPSWSRVNRGMVKMYQAEVLSKLPIMQHFLFGTLLPFETTSPTQQTQN